MFTVLQLSYHVDEQDNIRCYFYFAGQCARFLPEDIKLLLPLFFEETDTNTKFANGKEALFIIKSMRMRLKGMYLVLSCIWIIAIV